MSVKNSKTKKPRKNKDKKSAHKKARKPRTTSVLLPEIEQMIDNDLAMARRNVELWWGEEGERVH
jgi:hypothetical protein